MDTTVEFYDASCTLGRPRIASRKYFAETGELCREMDRLGIVRALVGHVVAEEHAPSVGNEMLAGAIGDADRLTPLWTALPAATGESPPPDELLGQMARAGARAVQLFPRTQSFRLADCDDLLGALAASCVPLFIRLAETGWEEILALCLRHPSLPVVLTETGYREGRRLFPALAARANLHLTLSHYQPHDGVGTLVDRFGPLRFLFATASPGLPGGMALGQILCARLDEPARRRIAAANLERLLAGCQLPAES